MFDQIVLHGGAASLLWGHRAAAVLTAWRISGKKGQWRLGATAARIDRVQCSQAITRKELRFTAPRTGGFWCWPVEAIDISGPQITAVLGPPEQ